MTKTLSLTAAFIGLSCFPTLGQAQENYVPPAES